MSLKPLTIKLPENYLEVLKAVAEEEGTTPSGLAARAVMEHLLQRAAAAETHWDTAGAATAQADIEAERDARWIADEQRRPGHAA
ncbi:hypothetical protein GFY24_16090 [Nocardia sp. SYP-A9097]|uniref:hypothetical protein n=1 Tax=Nocardia sp. SYP-A9097 TaxID=2663237 RepID=UPI00129B3E96|nr:hypothetical protein [Nocardia sp. SYP-A9097]MRH88947.1 hypothetical protein [Nocardia sp. SYP-A9097]